jgi:hypothetical protein
VISFVENVDQRAALLEPALIVAELEKRLEFLDGETIAVWGVGGRDCPFFDVRRHPGCGVLSRESRLRPVYSS